MYDSSIVTDHKMDKLISLLKKSFLFLIIKIEDEKNINDKEKNIKILNIIYPTISKQFFSEGKYFSIFQNHQCSLNNTVYCHHKICL